MSGRRPARSLDPSADPVTLDTRFEDTEAGMARKITTVVIGAGHAGLVDHAPAGIGQRNGTGTQRDQLLHRVLRHLFLLSQRGYQSV